MRIPPLAFCYLKVRNRQSINNRFITMWTSNTYARLDIKINSIFAVMWEIENIGLEKYGIEFVQRIFYMHIQIRFTSYRSMGETGPQHTQVPLEAAISPLAISPNPMHMNEWNKAWPQHRELHALLFANGVWVLLRPTGLWTLKGCETGRTVYRPYPRRLESLAICRCHYKGSTELF